MKLQTVATGLLFVALLAGSFVAGFALLGTPKADSNEPTQPPPQASNVPQTKPEVEKKKDKPAPPEPDEQVEKPLKPLTRADVSRSGDDCIGRRVTWVCRSRVSQAAAGHTQLIFFAEGPDGKFEFDNVFIAEEPEPYRQSPGWLVLKDATKRYQDDAHRRFEELKRSKQKRPKGKAREEAEEYWKLHPITVTGTISRLDTLILLGHGKRHDVPVLKDIKITAK